MGLQFRQTNNDGKVSQLQKELNGAVSQRAEYLDAKAAQIAAARDSQRLTGKATTGSTRSLNQLILNVESTIGRIQSDITNTQNNGSFFNSNVENTTSPIDKILGTVKNALSPGSSPKDSSSTAESTGTPSTDSTSNDPLQDIISSIPSFGGSIESAMDSFNKDGDASVFNSFLKYRDRIKDDPEKLKQYEALVQQVMDKAIFKTGDDKFNINSSWSQLKGGGELDKSMKYLLAASIVEMYHDRPQDINRVLKRSGGLKIGVFEKESDAAQAIYSNNSDNAIVLDRNTFLADLQDPSNQRNLLIHEFTHAADGIGKNNVADGILEGMSPSTKAKFLAARKELTEKHNSGGGLLAKAKQIFPWLENLAPEQQKTTMAAILGQGNGGGTGIRGYAFSRPEEFLTVTLEMFYDNPEMLKQESQGLFDAYNEHFKHYV